MIIIGYPGIGKSTLAKKFLSCIDLETSNFTVNGDKIPNWVEVYCKIAADMSSQGKTVFVSSHKLVRQNLKKFRSEKVVMCFPSLYLQDQWIEKLKKRYNNTKLPKDEAAYIRAKGYFEADITDLNKDPYEKIHIKSMNYSLKNILQNRFGFI